ncbi:MAG: hypothetical protein P1S60_18475 [Anaerolineae bacterium]|nr:hypothetical protein [Anaerolineae bacterium]
MLIKYVCGAVGVVLLLSGCIPAITPGANGGTSPIPEPVSPLSVPASPLATPVPTYEIAEGLTLVPFSFDRPLQDGDNRITGTGVPGIPIVIEDVTFAGKFIAAGQIDVNGRFDIQLSAPLEARHRIGLILNLADTAFTEEDFQAPGFRGEGAMVIPQIGFYHDTFMVLGP